MCLCISLHAQVHVYQERVWAVSFDCYPFRFTMQLVNSRQILRELTDSKATYTDNNNIINHHAHHGPAMPGLINQLIHKRAIVNTESLNHKHILC